MAFATASRRLQGVETAIPIVLAAAAFSWAPPELAAQGADPAYAGREIDTPSRQATPTRAARLVADSNPREMRRSSKAREAQLQDNERPRLRGARPGAS